MLSRLYNVLEAVVTGQAPEVCTIFFGAVLIILAGLAINKVMHDEQA